MFEKRDTIKKFVVGRMRERRKQTSKRPKYLLLNWKHYMILEDEIYARQVGSGKFVLNSFLGLIIIIAPVKTPVVSFENARDEWMHVHIYGYTERVMKNKMVTVSNKEQLEKWLTICEKASSEPWIADIDDEGKPGESWTGKFYVDASDEENYGDTWCTYGSGEPEHVHVANARFVEMARSAVPALIEEIKQQQLEIEYLKKIVSNLGIGGTIFQKRLLNQR